MKLSHIQTPLGEMIACATNQALLLLEFADQRKIEEEIAKIQQLTEHSSEASNRSILDQVEGELEEYFRGDRTEFSVPIAMPGTPFQQSVWEALQEIAFGETRSYGWLARKLGDPKSVRAVAHANGQNRIAIIVPCHRVIGADGSLTGYAGGLHRKKKLLQLEGASAPVPEGQERLF